jgi:glycosyltransferase involved in cell wall biosynthesis
MRIAVNLRQYFQGKIGGMENYVRNILAGLAHHSLTIWVHTSEVENVRALAPSAEIVGITHEKGEFTIARSLRSGQFDLFFCPLLVLEPLVSPIPSAVMMPDVQHHFYPEFFDADVLNWRRRTYGPSARNADVVFTLSDHAKSTIVDSFHIHPDKIVPVHLDVDPEFRRPIPPTPSPAFAALGLPARYLYFPANFWPHKNHRTVFQALQLALRSDSSLHLVLSGSPSGAGEVLAEARRLNIQDHVHFLGYVEKPLLPEIYRHALALLFATRFEGFGIPILEAFHCGTPVITSHSGSCLEVAADAAVLVDPLSAESIAAGILRVAADSGLPARLADLGAARRERFSWARAVEITAEAFARITDPAYIQPSPIRVEQWPRIGLVTPSFNMAPFLEDTIASVLSQDYPHLDYIVMDGGSTDGTPSLLRSYEDRLRWRSEPDSGQGDAVNKGFHAVTGEIFTFLNADDTYLPGALSAIAGHFRRNPSAGMIYGEAYHVDTHGKILDRYPTRPFDIDSLNAQCFICQPAAFMLREAFADAGMINSGLHYALDYDLWIRLARSYSVAKVDDYLATSRMHLDNKTLSSRRQVYQEIISVTRAHYGYVPYEWLHGYACYLLDRKDQYFDRSRPSIPSYLLALLLGARHNPHQLQRYWADWLHGTGIGAEFTSRWDDGWISRRYETTLSLPPHPVTLRVSGKHAAPISRQRLRLSLDGHTLRDWFEVPPGPFTLELPLPPAASPARFVIEARRTWRPRHGDYRRLSVVIDKLEQVPA